MLQIYDSLSRTKRPFVPVREGKVGLYVCGMTVYDWCHLGHARMLVSFDLVQRWLRVSGYQVTYVRNITDIDDKIIKRAVESNRRIGEVTEFFIDAMHADERALGVQAPDHQPRATEYVGDMLDIIAQLEKNGLAYHADDGDVNFAVREFAGYGKLSGKSLDDLRAGERVAVSSSKRDPMDFVLWKSAKEHEPADTRWNSPYGWGRPGWHIECSAMSKALLGLPLDIHGGGPDLKFPHHENEIAQTEGAYGGVLANNWMHCGPLMVDADKMSKSLGNFRTIRQTIGLPAQPDSSATYQVNPREAEMLRFFIARNHYRSPQNYAPDNLVDAQLSLDRFYQTLQNVVPAEGVQVDWSSPQAQAFREAMDDDFNTAGAIAAMFELATIANRNRDSQACGQMKALGAILGLLQQDPVVYFQSPTRYTRRAIENAEQGQAADVGTAMTEQQIEALIQERLAAKQAKNFAQADSIRATLKAAGIEIDDKPGGLTQWRRA
ncbi:cysteine--tRNA ligase [Orrella sp. NBD-18]|uniref:Cysteine--tRNA ligase n=1 Tax=Sheuella amnicola TaxID=2707330 RepID=A0A6B2R0U2_9BURK|nr:cysteine--tRNA ligase [Sheuella amnicola]NDY83882.1 cysteine--tRNA ligase [Sheuella amnicola]